MKSTLANHSRTTPRSPFFVESLVPKDRRFPPHSHDEYVISVNGASLVEEHVSLDRSRFRVGVEDITIYNPGEIQSSWAATRGDSPWECFSVHLEPETVAALTGESAFEAERPVVTAPDLANALRKAARVEDPHSSEEMATWVVAEVLDRVRGAGVERSPRTQRALPSTTDLQHVSARMRSDLHTPVRVSELARSVSMSPDHFIRSFVRVFGLPPYAWHLQVRLREGRRRLSAGEAPAQVAAELGFSDQAHFHRHFRAAYAQTPGEVRRRAG